MIRTLFFALVTVSTARAQLALWMSPEEARKIATHAPKIREMSCEDRAEYQAVGNPYIWLMVYTRLQTTEAPGCDSSAP